MYKITIILVAVLSLAACARGQLSSLPPVDDPADVAELVIFSKGVFNLLFDDQAFVAIKSGDFVHIRVNPGVHVVSVEFRNNALNKHNTYRKDLEITARPLLPTYVMAVSTLSYPHIKIYEINAYAASQFEKKYKEIEIVQ